MCVCVCKVSVSWSAVTLAAWSKSASLALSVCLQTHALNSEDAPVIIFFMLSFKHHSHSVLWHLSSSKMCCHPPLYPAATDLISLSTMHTMTYLNLFVFVSCSVNIVKNPSSTQPFSRITCSDDILTSMRSVSQLDCKVWRVWLAKKIRSTGNIKEENNWRRSLKCTWSYRCNVILSSCSASPESQSDSEKKSQIDSLKLEISSLKEQIAQQQQTLQVKTAQVGKQEHCHRSLLSVD